jgi:hypothetical protein
MCVLWWFERPSSIAMRAGLRLAYRNNRLKSGVLGRTLYLKVLSVFVLGTGFPTWGSHTPHALARTRCGLP